MKGKRRRRNYGNIIYDFLFVWFLRGEFSSFTAQSLKTLHGMPKTQDHWLHAAFIALASSTVHHSYIVRILCMRARFIHLGILGYIWINFCGAYTLLMRMSKYRTVLLPICLPCQPATLRPAMFVCRDRLAPRVDTIRTNVCDMVQRRFKFDWMCPVAGEKARERAESVHRVVESLVCLHSCLCFMHYVKHVNMGASLAIAHLAMGPGTAYSVPPMHVMCDTWL